jgi:hypothetical protein
MRKLNIGLVLLLIVLCLVLIFAVNAQHPEHLPEQHFEYASVIISSGIVYWQTGTDSYTFSGGDFVRNCQDMLIQLGGESVQIGRIRLVKNPIGMLDFLGEHGWEFVSAYYAKGSVALILFQGSDQAVYIFKRLVD